MTDHRLTPDPARITGRIEKRVVAGHTDLLKRPDGKRERQLLHGDTVTELSQQDGWSYVQAEKDGYCGYIRAAALGAPLTPTHKITARASHLYAEPDIKSADRLSLSYGTQLTALSEAGQFLQTDLGFVPRVHVSDITDLASDPAAVATLFLCTPYLWGGNTQAGIDCSGLIQAACLACGIPCPGDSDLQCDALGKHLPRDSAYKRNDLLFWRGHVALVTDEHTLIHANAGHMATTLEPIDAALSRIKAQGDGDPIAHKRL